MNYLHRIIFLSFSSLAFSQSPCGVGEVSLWLKSDAGRTTTLLYTDYNAILKNKILQATDNLKRAQVLVK